MSSTYIRTLRRRIAEAEKRFEAAKERGESDTYLAVAKYEIDEMKADLEREEKRSS